MCSARKRQWKDWDWVETETPCDAAWLALLYVIPEVGRLSVVVGQTGCLKEVAKIASLTKYA